MTSHADPQRSTSLLFELAADGSASGDDGAGGRLAAALRYACRIGDEAGYVLGLGDLEWLTGRGGASVVARVGWTPAREVTVLAETERSRPTALREVVEVTADDVDRAVAQGMERVHGLGVHWSAVLTSGRTIVGASTHRSGPCGTPPTSTLLEVGLRGAAVLDALDGGARDTWVVLDFERGALLVVAVGDHVLLAAADLLELPQVETVVAEARELLAAVDLEHASPEVVELPAVAEVHVARPSSAGTHVARGRGLRRRTSPRLPGRRRRG